MTACRGVVFLDADQAIMEERLLTRADQARAAGAPVRTDDNKESMKKVQPTCLGSGGSYLGTSGMGAPAQAPGLLVC